MIREVLDFFGIFGSVFNATWFVILPVAFYIVFKSLWGRHVFIQWITSQDDILLEIIPPREVERSPQTMEQFFNLLAGTDKGPNVVQKEVEGYVNPVFSLEIVGIEGSVHFFVRCNRKFRELVESGLYAQYPGVEIIDAEDYTWKVPRIVPNKEWTNWSADYKLEKHDAYPIRTYKDFEEDVTGKMIDPLHELLEAMSACGPGQQMWIQFIINAETPKWVNTDGMAQIDKFVGREKPPESGFARAWKDLTDVIGGVVTGWNTPPEFEPFGKESKDEQPLEFRLTPGEKGTLTALENNLSKAFFNVKMRMMVIGKKEGFTKANVSAVNGGIMKPFNDNFHNSILIFGDSKTDAEYLFKSKIVSRKSRIQLERFRDRDTSGVIFHLSTEELATLFHLPDMSVTAPGINFAGSRRGGAPANLPFT